MTLYGIDVSNHQREFDFARARAEGFSFATHKVTEGTWRDPWWPRARDEMQRHFPGRCGGYVFCKVGVDPQREADALLEHMGGTDLPLQVDYEDLERPGSGADLFARIGAFAERGFRFLPVYIPRWYWASRMGRCDLSGLPAPVWNSHYVPGTGFASELYPGDGWAPDGGGWADMGGKPVAILQFSEQATVAGRSPIDVNAYRGSDAELAVLFGAAPTEGDGMDQVDQGRVLAGAAQWSEPHVTDPARGTIGPRPLRHPERYNVRDAESGWGRAMLMDLWNDLVFDGYQSLVDATPEQLIELADRDPGSPVSFILRTHAAAVEARDNSRAILELLKEK